MSALRLLALTAAALALAAALGLVVPPSLRIDPLLVVAVLAALPGDRVRGIGGGLLTGFIEDAWVRDLFGQRAFTHMVVAYGVAFLGGRLDLSQPLPAVLVFAAATVADWGLQIGLALLFDRPLADLPGAGTWLAAAAGNVVLGRLALALCVPRRE